MARIADEEADLMKLRFPLKRGDVLFSNHPRAKHYVLRVKSDGQVQVTVPRCGNRREALAFANQHRDWIEKEREAAFVEAKAPRRELRPGDQIMLGGQMVELAVAKDWGRPVLIAGEYRCFIADEDMDLTRPLINLLRAEAKRQLPKRVMQLADSQRLSVRQVVIRDQRTRWGSCSSSRSISLNWRLIMMPKEVSDYIIIHELMHIRQMNHSHRFWDLVEKACPRFRDRVRWLDQKGYQLYP